MEEISKANKESNTALLGEVTASQDTFAKRMEGLMTSKTEVKPDPPKAELAASGIAGGIASIADFKAWGLPIGQAGVGLVGGVAVSELVDGFLYNKSNYMKAGAKVVAAWAVQRYTKKWLGAGAGAVSLLLIFDALRDVTPIDSWVSEQVGKITKHPTTAGLADKSDRRNPALAYGNKVIRGGSYIDRVGGN